MILFLQGQKYRCAKCNKPVQVMTIGRRGRRDKVQWQLPFAKRCDPCGIYQKINEQAVMDLFANQDHTFIEQKVRVLIENGALIS